ncbi:hypothetical protein C5O12_05495 [Akkermansia muciniphila]|nr:hypothetical protein C1O40_05875 [Akkermansia muciniphila]QAA59638.1 hypothetical protein C1O57_05580 [Akkermansia muciniphila]QAA61971.1 hypothetical protein C1O59_05495 [Akkermansia muciniphila]QAR51024.1 hypothetical protein SI90_12125 [Akkermansia muciniphila]QHV11584.1 hypothetical protein C5N97_05660 [Akkermansia muciniphila]
MQARLFRRPGTDRGVVETLRMEGLVDGAAPVPCCTFVAAWSSLSRKCRKPAFLQRPASAW